MPDVAFNTADRTVRAALVKQIKIEQQRCDYWRGFPEHAEDLADAQAAIARYMQQLDEGER